MEKYRFYVELPGDLWEDGTFMDLIRMNAAPLVRLRMSPSEAHRALLHGFHVCMVVDLDLVGKLPCCWCAPRTSLLERRACQGQGPELALLPVIASRLLDPRDC